MTSGSRFVHLGSLRNVEAFASHVREQGLTIPCDREILQGTESPLGQPIKWKRFQIENRFVIQPMEGWDGTLDGHPSDLTFRRWGNFGRSGAKLMWGCEAMAVRHDGRASPNQLLLSDETRADVARLRETLVRSGGSGLVVGLQLTHSGRYSRPNRKDRPEPRILYRHPILDGRLGLPHDYPLLTDGEIREIIEDFHRAARMAYEAGFDFVDVKHCHGYLGHEFLSAHERDGDYGGSFENRTRFLREVVQGIRATVPGLEIGVRLSAMDSVPIGRSGSPEPFEHLLPYRWGFGVNPANPVEPDLAELLGLATFAPEKFAERDRLWASGDAGYYALSDALQHLGNVAFRPPVPAYKHSAAVFLHACGRSPSPRTHARNSTRPEWEAALMEECATRLSRV